MAPPKKRKSDANNLALGREAIAQKKLEDLKLERDRLIEQVKSLSEGREFMEKDNEVLGRRVQELLTDLEIVHDKLQQLKFSSEETRANLEYDLQNHQNLKILLENKVAAAVSDLKSSSDKTKELEKDLLKMSEKNDKLKTIISQSPKLPKHYKKFSDAAECTKIKWCEDALQWLQYMVDEEDMDDFLSFFVGFVAKNSKFSFRLKMTAQETAIAKLKFKWSDKFMISFRAYCKKTLGFHLFASKASVDGILKEADIENMYTIEEVMAEKLTHSGKKVFVKSTIVYINDLKSALEDQVQLLNDYLNLLYDAGTGDDIVIGVSGDKGGTKTKICVTIENTQCPNDTAGQLLIGWYDGDDDHKNLEGKLKPLFDQINALEEIEYVDSDGNVIKKRVVKKMIGDCKYLASLFHHGGAKCGDPCFICQYRCVHKGAGKSLVGTDNFDVPGTIRTNSDFQATGRPLTNSEPASVGPPGIHTMHGLGQNFVVDQLFAVATQLDTGDDLLPGHLKQQHTYLKNLKEQQENLKERCDGLVNTQKDLKELGEALTRMKNDSKKVGRGKPCDAPICLVRDVTAKCFNKNEVFMCKKCGKTNHLFCNIIMTDDARLAILEGKKKQVCTTCELGKPPTLDVMLRRNSQIQAQVDVNLKEDEIMFCTIKEEVDKLEEILKKSNGPYRQKLEKVFLDMECDYRAWYQEMTGNQMRKMLRADNIRRILDVFPDSPRLRAIGRIMEELSLLMTHSDNAIKDDDDLDEIENSIRRFVAAMREAHPTAGVTLKLHLLTAHLMPYLRRFRSWGRISEQGIEHIHAEFNLVERNFCSVRDEVLKSVLILRHFHNQNTLFAMGLRHKLA